MDQLQNKLSPSQICAAQSSDARHTRFRQVTACWVCEESRLKPVIDALFDLSIYREQDPELAGYSGETVTLNRCQACGFMQPAALPTLPMYFERMYDTRWSEDWVENEFVATYRDPVFRMVLSELDRRVAKESRSLLDVGAHVGKFVEEAARARWNSEGIELNPTTAAFAAKKTGRTIHQCRAEDLVSEGRFYDAVTILDVLEHIPEPAPLLNGLLKLLKPGGWLALKVPCGENQLRKERILSRVRRGYAINLANNLVHVNHFTARSLKLALERAGFEHVHLMPGMPEDLPLKGAMDLKGLTSRYFRRCVYTAGKYIPGGAYTPLALNLQAFARRPS